MSVLEVIANIDNQMLAAKISLKNKYSLCSKVLFKSKAYPESGRKYLSLIIFICIFFLTACGSQSTPLDANTRRAIDSTTTAQIVVARKELDSLCEQRRLTEMPHLVDSIKEKRLEEIQKQLKAVPK